jgi:protein ImuB
MQPSTGSGAPDEPQVLIEKARNALRIAAVDRAAAKLGLEPGLALADARARVPALAVADLDRAADDLFLEHLADACDRYTPLVALDPPHGLILDVAGCDHLFGGEEALCRDLRARLLRAGFGSKVSIAGTPDAARALVRFGRPLIVAPGEEALAVRPLPVAALGTAPETVTALVRAGLKTIGSLADRPRAPLAARFGSDLLARLQRTLGEEDIRITPRRPPPACTAQQAFPEPIGRESDIQAALLTLAGELADVLAQRGDGGRRFEASFFRADGKVQRIGVETGRPARDPKGLMRLFNERLAALADPLDPGFGFDLIRLDVPHTETFSMAQVSLDGRESDEEEAGALADRIGARLGSERVVRFVPVDSHIPERAVRRVPVAAKRAEEAEILWTAPQQHKAMPRPLHLFTPPQPIETLAEVPDGPPLRFLWRRVQHTITRAEGPERIAPEWWRAPKEALNRDYYRVEDRDGRRFWVFRQGVIGRETLEPRWFLHGLFP